MLLLFLCAALISRAVGAMGGLLRLGPRAGPPARRGIIGSARPGSRHNEGHWRSGEPSLGRASMVAS